MFNMKLTIITQNLQGVNCPLKIDIVKNYYWVLKSSIDVLCFQEHRLRGSKLLDFGRTIWPRAKFVGNEASLGYGHNVGEAGAGKGGVCMWISPNIQHMVAQSGSSRCGRAQWIRLQGTPAGDLSILNIYASTVVRERMELWAELLSTLPKDCKWILCGDWNFVENSKDKSSLCGKLVSPIESQVFNSLISALCVEENFPRTNPIKFSWDNRRQDGARVLAQLDRIYSFQADGGQASPVAEYFIKGDSNHSDHLPVWGKFLLKNAPIRKSSYKMSARYLEDDFVKTKISHIWSIHSVGFFFGKLRKVVKFYKEYCLKEAK